MFSSMLSLLGSLRRGNFVTNSLRFRSSASAYLNRTPTVLGDRRIFTWSGWLKRGTLGTVQYVLFAGTTSTDYSGLAFSNDQFFVTNVISSGGTLTLGTQAVFRDPSAWYHFVVSIDTTQALSTNGVRMWVNGVAQTLNVTTYTQNTTFQINNTIQHSVSSSNAGVRAQYFDGYLTEVNFIDGQALTPSSFGQIESTTGVWSPKQYVGTYGTNGFYLKFGNTSSVAALGNDSSGNNNTFTVNNVSLTAGATYDSMLDVPVNYSDSGNGRGNYAVLNPVNAGMASTIFGGNLTFAGVSNTNQGYVVSTIGVNSGSFYFELTPSSFTGILEIYISGSTAVVAGYRSDGTKDVDNINSAYGAAWTASDIIGCAFNSSTKSVTFYKNNVSQGSFSYTASGEVYPTIAVRGTGSANGYVNFGQRPFNTTNGLPPAGFLALHTNNLPTPSIVNGANFMAATTYTGNAAARSLSNAVNNVSFQPDLVWIKSRTPGATSHALFDPVRGTTKYLSSDTSSAETTNANTLTAFNGDGFSLGTDTTLVNANANSYIAWQWKAGGNTTTNTSGTITSQVNASPTAGFSIVTYTGTGTNNPTIGHGLNEVPAMIILKNRDTSATNWFVYHKNIGTDYYILLNLTNQRALINSTTSGAIGTSPNSSTFTFASGTNNSLNGNTTGIKYVAYCFAEIAGFSKFGSYTGNGVNDGPFVFCGFRPRYILLKRFDSAATASWVIRDSSRNIFNAADNGLWANLIDAELDVSYSIDIVSNGFKIRAFADEVNASAGTYIFAAFAETPSKYALAR